jgi:hypothetical protein
MDILCHAELGHPEGSPRVEAFSSLAYFLNLRTKPSTSGTPP